MHPTPIGRSGQAVLALVLFIAAIAPSLAAPVTPSLPDDSFLLDPPVTLPYWQDFSTYPPAGWTGATGLLADPTTLTGTSSGWTHGAFANLGAENNSAKLHIYGTDVREWMFTPPIEFRGIGPALIRFTLALTAHDGTGSTMLGSDDKVAVVVSRDGGATWSHANVVQQWDSNIPISNTGQSFEFMVITFKMSSCSASTAN